jgi:hypothetical protein
MELTATSGHVDHGPHVRDRKPGAGRLLWYEVHPRAERERELRWTCGCLRTVYVLMRGGGKAWIRRIIRPEADYEVRRGRLVAIEPGAVVRDTEALYHRPAAELWVALLYGRAR